jgi:hypothetical protein
MVYQKEKQFRDNDYKKINTSANMFRFEIFFLVYNRVDDRTLDF